jgi:hypothetical protein
MRVGQFAGHRGSDAAALAMGKRVVSDLYFTKTIRFRFIGAKTDGAKVTSDALRRPKSAPPFGPRWLAYLAENIRDDRGKILLRRVLNATAKPLGWRRQIVRVSRDELDGSDHTDALGNQTRTSTDYARSVSRLLPMLRDARDARSSA